MTPGAKGVGINYDHIVKVHYFFFLSFLLYWPRQWYSWFERSSWKVGCSTPDRDRPN